MTRLLLLAFLLAGCAAQQQHITYYSSPARIGGTDICAAAKVEVAGTGPCEDLPITNYELVVVPCGAR